MARLVSASRAQRASGPARLAGRVADALGGRYFTELGIDFGAGDAEIERWFLAAALFGTRIWAAVAERTFGVLSDAGLARIVQARQLLLDGFVAFLLGPGSARLPQCLSASPGWPPGVTPAAGISKAAWSGSPWRITARGWADARAGTCASCSASRASEPCLALLRHGS